MDKPHYLTGDDIWLKGYVTIGAQNQLSAMSNILYVDLISPSNKVVINAKFLILHGTAIGDLHLTDTLEEGTYHLRAYTNWMRNLPETTFFNKTFTIGHLEPDPVLVQSAFSYNEATKQLSSNITLTSATGIGVAYAPVDYNLWFDDKTNASGTAKTDNKGNVVITFNNNKNIDLKTGVLTLKYEANGRHLKKEVAVSIKPAENKISFMPEGGSMVAGIQGRVAFKMLQPDGFAASGSGYITDESGTKISEFSSGYAGMGSIYFLPEAGKNYKAIVTYANGKTQTTSLPAVQNEGYALAVYLQPAYASIAISVSPALVKNQQVSILVQKQGQIIYAGQKAISSEQSLIKLPLDKCPSGIIQVTLFNQDMQPICERLFFNINKNTILALTAEGTSQHYKTRQPVTITLNAGGSADSARVGSFSASVVNIDKLPPLRPDSTSILSGLLLTPELKGYIETPDHYFEGANNSRMADLDNLILCQGWRRIVWDDIKQGKMPAILYQPENSFTISGTVTQRNGKPAAKARVSLLSTSSFVRLDTVTDTKGRFVFDRLLIKDKNKFAVRAKDAEGKRTVVVKVDDLPALSNLSPNSNIQYPDDATYQAFLRKNFQLVSDTTKQRLSAYHLLNDVQVVAKKDKKSQVPEYSSNLNGPGNADHIYLPNEFETSMSLKQFLNGRGGVKFTDDTPYTTRGDNFAMGGSFTHHVTDPMRIYWDGIWVNQDDYFSTEEVSVADLASIEILNSVGTSALYGQNNGIIILTTKLGRSDNSVGKASSEYAPFIFNGYNTIREFYSPQYAVAAKPGQATDHRTTIFWKPDVVTNKAGKATFMFYTSDDKGVYRLNIQGITADGRIGQLTQTITVE